jgi:3-hydroxyisobutyrate dehydrogenase
MHAGGAKVLGVIGLGSMGYGAALTALRKGVPTVGLDTRTEARQRFEAEGGATTDSLAALGAQCDAVVVLVVNAAQTEEVLFSAGGLAGAARSAGAVADRCAGLGRCRQGRGRADDGDGLRRARGVCGGR